MALDYQHNWGSEDFRLVEFGKKIAKKILFFGIQVYFVTFGVCKKWYSIYPTNAGHTFLDYMELF